MAQNTPVVGKLTAARNAELSTTLATGAARYAPAQVGMDVREGFGVRTRRRSFAEITFTDGSAIRVNEQTDMIIQSAATLRRIRLEKGQAWVKDRGGSRTSVQTPVGTATARGTEFIVSADGKVEVKEGEVELEAGGVSLLLGAGQSGGIGPSGTPERIGGGQSGGPGDGGEGGDPWYDKAQQMPAPSLIGGGLVTGAIATQMGERSSGGEPVPEPATIAALAIGAAALLRRRRNR